MLGRELYLEKILYSWNYIYLYTPVVICFKPTKRSHYVHD